jgi:tetratricopeptide (TPR) repeat protein/serine phosphatase RsbU (regulator of sigma subunit)
MLQRKTHLAKYFTHFFCVFFIVTLNSVFNTGVFAQIDSLQKELKKCKSDTSKVNILNELSYYYMFEDVNNSKKYSINALELATKINFERGIMRSYGQLGNLFNTQNKFEEAIESYINGLRIAETRKDIQAQSSFTHNIGILYIKLEQNKKAEEFILQSIEFDKKTGDQKSIAVAYNTLGSIFYRLADFDKAQVYFNEALKYVNKSNPDLEDAPIFLNIGVMYKRQGRLQLAKDFFQRASEVYLNFGSTINAGKAFYYIAEMEFEFKHFDKAIIYYEKTLKLIPDLHLKTVFDFDVKRVFVGLAESYLQKKDFKNAALSYQKLIQNFDLAEVEKDSIRSDQSNKAFFEMAAKYETEKKDAALRESKLETERQKEENAKKNVILYSLTGGGLLLVLTLFFVLRSYRISRAQTRKIKIQKTQIEKQRDEIAHINKEVTASIEYAKNIQNSILPDLTLFNNAFKNYFVLWLPRDIVSGDFYWFHEENGYIFIAAADCTGHGVPGAFVSVSCVNILNQVVIDEKVNNTSGILARVHQHVCDIFRKKDSELKSNDGMDISICRIDKKNMEIQFSGAMNSLVKICNGDVDEIKGDRSAIGGRTPYNFNFSHKLIKYSSEDVFYMFSDGFKDQFGGPHGKKYLNSRFLQLLLKINTFPLSEQKEMLQNELINWCANDPRIDDVLVLGFKP